VNTLFLDIASHTATVACADATAAMALQSTEERVGDNNLIPMVESVLQEAEWQYGDIERIACVVGPGGFTSLRVAVTFANVLADQCGIPSAGVHLSAVYRARMTDADVFWLHSTKKDQLFACGGIWKEPTLIGLDQIPEGDWMGELIDEQRDKAGTMRTDVKPLQEVLPTLLHSLGYSKESLEPWYGRGW